MVLTINIIHLRGSIMDDNDFVISAGKYLGDVIVEAHAKDVAVVLCFHGHWFTNASHRLFQIPQ